MLPVLLDLNGRLVLVVGGGAVGLRKAAAARAAGGRVRLVCLEPRPAGLEDPAIDWRQEPYAEAHLDGVVLALAAGPAGVNAQVAADARRRGLWVNVATDPAAGDVYLPATVRRGGLVVAVGTGGAAPALAARLRRRLEEELDPALADWVALLAELRPVVLATVADEGRRREAFERLADWAWLGRLRSEGVEAVRRAMRESLDSPG